LGLITGDIIHNLRSCLDHLAWQLVDANGGKPSSHTMFPIFEDPTAPTDYKSRIERILKGASPDAIKLVQSLHPYKGGNDGLYALHRLDITDKHRLLITVGIVATAITIYTAQIDINRPPNMPRLSVPMELWPPFGTFPLEDGAEIHRISPASFADARLEVDMNPEFKMQIAFGEHGVFEGEPLVAAPTVLSSAARSRPGSSRRPPITMASGLASG
jgi:hypothetical protein